MSLGQRGTSKPTPREIRRDIPGRPIDIPAAPAILDRPKEPRR